MQMASQPGYDVVNMKEVLKVEWSFKFSLNQTGLVINGLGFSLFWFQVVCPPPVQAF